MIGNRDITRVIVLDFDNAARSQMAEAFLRRLGGERLEVHSGGIIPGPVHPLTIAVMGEIGYDLAGQRGKSAQLFFGHAAFQVAILVSRKNERQCPHLFPGALRIERWENDDPLAGEADDRQRLERFRAVRECIRAQAAAWWKAFAEAHGGALPQRQLAAVGH